MSTTYIYSSSRVKALEKSLLNESDVERLLSAASVTELLKVLKGSYLANFIKGDKVDDVLKALEEGKFEVKTLLDRIAPEPALIDYFWFRFDMHNLRIAMRAKKTGSNLEEVLPFLSKLGKYNAVSLFESAITGGLDRFDHDLKTIFDLAIKTFDEKGVVEADIEIDKGYFTLTKNLVERYEHKVLAEILRLQIDLYNLKTSLRTQTLKITNEEIWFVKGGSFSFEEIDTKEKSLTKLSDFGGEKLWKDAISEYVETGHFTLINVKVDDYFLSAVKNMDSDVFSVVTLISYLLKQQNMSLNIQTIMAGKESGQSEEVIRKQLRNIYV